jgi:hypothetical protein
VTWPKNTAPECQSGKESSVALVVDPHDESRDLFLQQSPVNPESFAVCARSELGRVAAVVPLQDCPSLPGTVRPTIPSQLTCSKQGCDIRTVQQLMGHKDMSTTMIYAHVPKTPGLGVTSPLDRHRPPEIHPVSATVVSLNTPPLAQTPAYG